jgi:outer membrane protein OmpA-like peptidoglycan-associated protein
VGGFHLRNILVALLAAGMLTVGCQKNIVVLLPDPDGSVGHISVANPAGSVEMDTANTSTSVRDAATPPSQPDKIAPKDIQNLFGDVLEKQPPRPVHFMLYFEKDSTRLRPGSFKILDDVVATIKERRSDHISVVGHSDTLGDKTYNLNLSRRRADAVQALLEEKGIPATSIQTTSHGEENPLVKTADNVGNPKNRRVEVVVR